MNKSSDDLVAEEDGYIDNVENRDLQSLIELRYVHDGQKQYATKDDVAIRVFEGIELLPSKSISFIVFVRSMWRHSRCILYCIARLVFAVGITCITLV